MPWSRGRSLALQTAKIRASGVPSNVAEIPADGGRQSIGALSLRAVFEGLRISLKVIL